MSSRKEVLGLQPYQHVLFNKQFRLNEYYEDPNKVTDRSDKSLPDMRHIVHTDMKRSRNNQLYERQLNQHVIGARGLQWQHKQELQRLNRNERHAERDLVQLQREVSKMVLLPLIEPTPSPVGRLEPISEEELIFPLLETSRLFDGESSPRGRRQVSPRKSQSWLKRNRFPHVIAKTSTDHPYAYLFPSQKSSLGHPLRQH